VLLHELGRRLESDTETEVAANLQQVFAITRMRLARAFESVAAAA